MRVRVPYRIHRNVFETVVECSWFSVVSLTIGSLAAICDFYFPRNYTREQKQNERKTKQRERLSEAKRKKKRATTVIESEVEEEVEGKDARTNEPNRKRKQQKQIKNERDGVSKCVCLCAMIFVLPHTSILYINYTDKCSAHAETGSV